jgi:hypothetical protein
MKDLLDKTKSPSIESNGMLLVNTKDGHCPAQPSLPRKRMFTPELGTYRKRMRGSRRDLVLGEVSQSGQNLKNTFVAWHELPWETFIEVCECELAGF